ncbi:MAG: hypothetical protein WCO38_09520 [Verrucomicrobiota bacterium]
MTNKLSKSVEKNLNRAGRPAGSTNKSTSLAREAIAKFVEANAPKMEKWLSSVAEGKPKLDKDGNQIYSKDGEPDFIVAPNPLKAFEMLQTVMEYHVPKLARTEVVGDKENPIIVQTVNF